MMENFPLCLRTSLKVIPVLGMVWNASLIPLVTMKSKLAIGPYKCLYINQAHATLIMAVLFYYTLPLFDSTEVGWVLYSSENLLASKDVSKLLCLYLFSYSYLVTHLAGTFFFRYLTMARRCTLRVNTYAVFFLSVIGFTATFLALVYHHDNLPFKDATVSQGILNVSLEETSFVGMPVHSSSGVGMGAIGFFAFVTIVMFASSTVTIFCGAKCISKLRNYALHTDLSQRTKSLHRKILALILLQSTLPLVLEYIPLLASFVLAWIGHPCPYWTSTFSLMVPASRFFDPLLIFIVLTDYTVAHRKLRDSLISNVIWGFRHVFGYY